MVVQGSGEVHVQEVHGRAIGVVLELQKALCKFGTCQEV